MTNVPRYWSPALIERSDYREPPIGELIGFRGRAYRVIAVDEIPETDWTDDERDWLSRRTWGHRPHRVRVLPVDDEREHGMRVSPWQSPIWHVLPEHYAICATCGDLAPCAGHHAARAAAEAARRAEKDMAVLPGFCPSCNEPITHRQKAITYPGPNVLNPLGQPNVRFHTRRKCLAGASRYEEAWVAVDPIIRPRSRLTLRCTGSLIVHGDGTAECHDAQDCPTVYAHHPRLVACYLQDRGCPRECPRDGHPGTRLANPPADLWSTP